MRVYCVCVSLCLCVSVYGAGLVPMSKHRMHNKHVKILCKLYRRSRSRTTYIVLVHL